MRADDPSMGCIHPGCSAHPANRDNGGPIFRLSAKGERFRGACGKHFNLYDCNSTEKPSPAGWVPNERNN